jgi:hypothetical protein
MKENMRKELIGGFSRRDFLGGLILGGGIATAGMWSSPLLTSYKNDEKIPIIAYYPITLWDDLYKLFMHIGQTLIPSVRRLSEYQKHEVDAFKAVFESNFFIYANDYAIRIQKHYANTSLLIPSDKVIAEKLLTESIREYPQAWSRILSIMLTNSPQVLIAFVSEDKS